MKGTKPHDSKEKIIAAATRVFRTKGYAATTVEGVCLEAGLTKGSFFHHFKGKEEMAIASVDQWNDAVEILFSSAGYQAASDPVDRLLGYLDVRFQLIQGEMVEYTCLIGTLVQEVYASHDGIRSVCEEGLSGHIASLARDVEQAKSMYCPNAEWSAESVGFLMQSVLQGSFILAKATGNPDVIRGSILHLKRYLESLFKPLR